MDERKDENYIPVGINAGGIKMAAVFAVLLPNLVLNMCFAVFSQALACHFALKLSFYVSAPCPFQILAGVLAEVCEDKFVKLSE